MTFSDLLDAFKTGLALHRLDELRAAAAGFATTKAQRKHVVSEVENARARGRVGRIANLILIGLVTDRSYWLDWLRRSPVLRPSTYDLDTSTLKRLLPLVRQNADNTILPADFIAFLDHLEWLMILAEAAHKKRTAVLKLIGRDKLLVKSCLVTTDLLFIGRTDYLTLHDLPLSPEDAAGALSYLIYLTRKRSGPSGISLAGII